MYYIIYIYIKLHTVAFCMYYITFCYLMLCEYCIVILIVIVTVTATVIVIVLYCIVSDRPDPKQIPPPHPLSEAH